MPAAKGWDNMLLKVETEDLTCLRKHVSLVQNSLFSCKPTIGNWCSQWVAMAPCHCYSWWGWWSDTLWVMLKGYDYTHYHVMFKVFLKLLLWRFLCNFIDNFKFLAMESLIVPHGMLCFFISHNLSSSIFHERSRTQLLWWSHLSVIASIEEQRQADRNYCCFLTQQVEFVRQQIELAEEEGDEEGFEEW